MERDIDDLHGTIRNLDLDSALGQRMGAYRVPSIRFEDNCTRKIDLPCAVAPVQ